MSSCVQEGDTVSAQRETECAFEHLFAAIDPLKWDDNGVIIEYVLPINPTYADGGWSGEMREIGSLEPYGPIDNILNIKYKILQKTTPRLGYVSYSLKSSASGMSLNTGQLWVWEEVDAQGTPTTYIDFSKAADFAPDLFGYCFNMQSAMEISVELAMSGC